MADGYNQARAMRIAEIINDFRGLMSYISGVEMNTTSPEEYHSEGYTVLRRCIMEAQALLAQPFQAQEEANDAEQQKANLRRIITDAAVRRFQAQRLYMRVTAVLRWVNMRAALAQRGPAQNFPQQYRQVDDSLRSELSRVVTDEIIYQRLRYTDDAAGKWQAEDPSLATIQRAVAANGSGSNRS